MLHSVENIGETPLIPENHARHADNVFGAITCKNILCIPAERALEVKSAPEVTGPEDHPRHWSS